MAKDATTAVLDAPTSLPERMTLGHLDQYEEDKKARRARQQKRLGVMTDCLDPEVASRYEKKKPLLSWRITCSIRERVERHQGSGRFEYKRRKIEGEVEAHNESDAWAMFCDQNGIRPNPNGCDRKITQISKPPEAA